MLPNEVLWNIFSFLQSNLRIQNASLAARVKAVNLSEVGITGEHPAILLDVLEAACPRLNLPDSFEEVLLEAIESADNNGTGAREMLFLLLLLNVEKIEYRSFSDANLTLMAFFADIPYARGLTLWEVRISHSDDMCTKSIAEVPVCSRPPWRRCVAGLSAGR